MFKARGTRILSQAVHERPDPVPSVLEHPGEPQPLSEIAVESFGLPAMPVDFLDQVRAAQAGDSEAIAIMRDIGAMVPDELKISFAAYVQDMLETA